MRKRTAILCVLLLILSLSACGDEEKVYSNQTVMGRVVSIDGNDLTLQIAVMPEGMNSAHGNMPQGQMPNGENGTPPQGQTPSSGENGSLPQMSEGGQIPEGGLGGGQEGQLPQNNGDMPDMFGENGETITFSLDDVAIKVESGTESIDGTKDDIKADSMVMVEFGDNNTVKTITVRTQNGFEIPNTSQQTSSASGGRLSA